MRTILFLLMLIACFCGRAVADGLSQPRDYPGYCLRDWRGEVSCFEGSDEPWPAMEFRPGIVHLLEGRGSGVAGRHRCSGTLVAPDWIVTAAHCVDDRRRLRRTTIGIGFAPQLSGLPPRDGVEMEIAEVVIHPERRGHANDIALVRFAEQRTVHIANPGLSPGVRTYPRNPHTAFPPPGDPDIPFADISGQRGRDFRATAVLFRWSEDPRDDLYLSAAPVFQLSDFLCDQSRGRRDPERPASVTCVLSHERPMCPQDSGAPVIGGDRSSPDTWVPEERLLVGIATWDRRSCGEAGEPGWIIPLAEHREWIRATVHESFERRWMFGRPPGSEGPPFAEAVPD